MSFYGDEMKAPLRSCHQIPGAANDIRGQRRILPQSDKQRSKQDAGIRKPMAIECGTISWLAGFARNLEDFSDKGRYVFDRVVSGIGSYNL